MRRAAFVLILVTVPFAQAQRDDAQAARNTVQLLARVKAAPHLDLAPADLTLQAPREGWAVEMVSSVAAASDGTVYVLQRGPDADPVLAVDSHGRIQRSWGAGLYTIPHSIRVDPAGNVWTVDAGSSQIYKFSPEGEELLHIDVGEMPEKSSPFRGTADIAFAPDGNLLIADGYGNARILEYTPQGKRISSFGRPGTGPGELNLPHSVAIDEGEIIYVGDRENGRIQRFDRTGKYLDQWDGLGKTYCLQLDGDAIWLGAHRLDQANGSPGWLMKLDRDSGVIVGLVDSTGTHSVTVNSGGEPLTGTRPDRVLWFRARSR
ncbi:MAG: 6-bladed beta-propeller [Acidobacteria bacterium]|nr:6-bladed beta-propeller [Acidobacteriota bacterium]